MSQSCCQENEDEDSMAGKEIIKDDALLQVSLQVKDYQHELGESQCYSLGSPNTAENHSS